MSAYVYYYSIFTAIDISVDLLLQGMFSEYRKSSEPDRPDWVLLLSIRSGQIISPAKALYGGAD